MVVHVGMLAVRTRPALRDLQAYRHSLGTLHAYMHSLGGLHAYRHLLGGLHAEASDVSTSSRCRQMIIEKKSIIVFILCDYLVDSHD